MNNRRLLQKRISIAVLSLLLLSTLAVIFLSSPDTDAEQPQVAAGVPLYPSCESMLNLILEKRIQLVAIDFDKTLIDIHTGGLWRHAASDLVPHVRPELQCLLYECVKRGIPLAVTTFSSQKTLIQLVTDTSLRQFAHSRNAMHQPSNIPVFGGGIFLDGLDEGKQSQLAAAMEHFSEHRLGDGTIAASGVVLIDDDEDNIRVAKEDGFQVILFQPISDAEPRQKDNGGEL
ncbi:expressed unknown protein [Seminavis robusta]|uniref:Uncharacterized protein n=1 Tax=Seminavis robusta TaxID=568900 RepID=A0A9N8E6G5_9STRA|nr:expressed unknown protein [Seminavis robusta]|eukprot:Sro723_g193020.1 n/a (231) ;mRNA; r:30991-31683